MSSLTLIFLLGVLAAGAPSPPDLPGVTCGCEAPIEVESDITFARTYSGDYKSGEPYDQLTVHPDGSGETFTDIGVTIRMRLASCGGRNEPYSGAPPQDIVLWSPDLYFCEPAASDAGTDADGWFTFSGTMAAGGCAQGLMVFIEGLYISTIPINVNSPDTGTASPGFIDSADLTAFSRVLGDPSAWNICFDFNESGPPSIDSGDLAYLAGTLGAACD